MKQLNVFFWPSQKCYSKVMHRKEATHSNGSYVRKSHGRKLADEMGRAKKKFPWYTTEWCTGREWPELHDSYFRLMTIKHLISKIEWAFERLYNSVEFDEPVELSSGQRVVDSWVRVPVEPRCDRGSHIRPKGPGALMSWGPEKMLIRCNKESHHTAEWAPRPPVEHQKNKTTWRS